MNTVPKPSIPSLPEPTPAPEAAPPRPGDAMRGALGFFARFFPQRHRAFEADVRIHAIGTDQGDALGRISKSLTRGGHQVKEVLDTTELEG